MTKSADARSRQNRLLLDRLHAQSDTMIYQLTVAALGLSVQPGLIGTQQSAAASVNMVASVNPPPNETARRHAKSLIPGLL